MAPLYFQKRLYHHGHQMKRQHKHIFLSVEYLKYYQTWLRNSSFSDYTNPSGGCSCRIYIVNI
jgi:hypothetical protein